MEQMGANQRSRGQTRAGSGGHTRGEDRSRSGRRPGGSGTRAAVIVAARRQFAEVGYDRTTMRSVAAEAGVDQKLVGYFFGSKQRLFVAATELPVDPAEAIPAVLSGDPARIGERMARLVLEILESPDTGGRMTGLIRAAAAEPEAAQMVRDLLTRQLWARGADLLPADEPELRISLMASQLIGLIMARYVIRAEPLASLPAAAVANLITPVLQHYLTGEAPAHPDAMPAG
jgi:AcrR family transcriptional regulator